MDGGDRAGYKQIARNVQATIITSTMSAAVTTGDWAGFEVISSYAAVAVVQASGITGASRLTSGRPLPLGSYVGGGKTTGLRLSVKSTGHKIIAYNRILL
jgi:hypothetical protein